MPCFFGLFLDPASHFGLCLVEKADDLAGNVLTAGLLLVHDTGGGGENDIAELTGRKELDNPLLELSEADVVAGGDDTALVEAEGERSASGPSNIKQWKGGHKLTGR